MKRRLQPQCQGSRDLVPPRSGGWCPDLAWDTREGHSRPAGTEAGGVKLCVRCPQPSALPQDPQSHTLRPRSQPVGTKPGSLGGPEQMGRFALRTETPGEVGAAAEPLRPPPLPSAPLHSSQALCLVQEETASGRMGSWGKGDSGLGLCGRGGTCSLLRLGLGQSCWEKRYVGEGDGARSRLGG